MIVMAYPVPKPAPSWQIGPNLFRDYQQQALLLQFLSRFKNPLVILLLVACAISAFIGEITNFVIISIMVLFSVTLDFVQEHRAGKATESLRHSVSVKARVVAMVNRWTCR